jgi:hypothetical protein
MQRETFRPKFTRVVAVLVIIGVLVLLADVLRVGGLSAAARDVGPLGLLAWAAWVALWRPALHVGEENVTVVNPLRTITVPWAAVRTIDTRYALTLTTAGGRWTSYAAPAPGRSSARKLARSERAALDREVLDDDGAIRLGDLPESDSGRAHKLVRGYWQQHRFEDSSAREQVRWSASALAVGAVLLAATVASAL